MRSTSTVKTIFIGLMDIVFLGLLLGVFYAVLMGSHPLFTPDEGRYSEVAREMLASGDFITPRLDGVAFLDKPILYYWMQASAIHLFGLKEWALRFWPAFMGVFGSLMVYLAGTILFNRRTALFSALIVATSPLYYGAAHYANLDLEVGVLIGNALLFFIMAMQFPFPSFKRSILLMAAYLFAGFAALTKGLIGIAFPIMVIGAWILILNRWSTLKRMHLGLGLLLFSAVTLPWYILVQKANPQFFHFFFVTQQFSRFLTHGDYNNKAAIWFYLPIILIGIFPWTIFAIQGLFYSLKKIIQNRETHANELFLWLWFLIVLVFFSIPKSKTVGYILPLFQSLALLIGYYLNAVWETTNFKAVARALILFILLCSLAFLGFLEIPHIKSLEVSSALIPYLHLMAGLLMLGAIRGYFLLRQHSLAKTFYSLFTFAIALLFCISASTIALNDRTIKPLAETLTTQLKPNDEVISFYKFYYDLPLYTQRRITVVADWKAADIAQNDNWVRELWYGIPFQDTSSWLIDKDTFKQRWQSANRLFVMTDTNRLADLKAIIPGTIYTIAQYHTTLLLSNQAG